MCILHSTRVKEACIVDGHHRALDYVRLLTPPPHIHHSHHSSPTLIMLYLMKTITRYYDRKPYGRLWESIRAN